MQALYQDSTIINIGEIFGNNSFLEITSWKRGVSWILHELTNNVQNYHVEMPIWELPSFSLSFIEKTSKAAGQPFILPLDVKDAINAFEDHYENHAHTALWFTSRIKEARELLLSAPFIFWCVLEHAKTQGLEPDETFALFSYKRSQILQLMGFEGTKAQIKTLQRIQFPKQFKSVQFAELTQFFETFSPKEIGRLKSIDFNLISLLNQYPDLINAKWLQNLSNTELSRVRESTRNHLDCEAMHRTLNLMHQIGRVKACITLDALNALHDQLVDQINEQSFQGKEFVVYPSSPIQQTDIIQYIADSKMLHEEGLSQKHCVYSYHQKIVSGCYLVYQYLGEQRATIGISVSPRGYRIDQIKGKRNTVVSEEIKNEIAAWLYQSSS